MENFGFLQFIVKSQKHFRHRKRLFIIILLLIDLTALISITSLVILGSSSRFDTKALLTTNGFASFIQYLPFSYNSNVTVYISMGVIFVFMLVSVFGMFYLIFKVKATLIEFQVVGSPTLSYQVKLLRILYFQLFLGTTFLFVPLVLTAVFVFLKWEYSSLFSSSLILFTSFYPVISNISMLTTTPHFWERIWSTFKPIESQDPESPGCFGLFKSRESRQRDLYRY